MQKVETFTVSIYPWTRIKENTTFEQENKDNNFFFKHENKDNNLNDKKSKWFEKWIARKINGMNVKSKESKWHNCKEQGN